MFWTLMGFALLLLIYAFIYLDIQIIKIPLIKKIKYKIIRIIIAFLLICSFFLIFDFINSLVIIIHVFLLTLIAQLCLFIFKKVSKKSTKDYYVLLLGLAFSVVYLSIGAFLDFKVFETHYEIETTKDLGTDNFRVVHISDSHVGTTFDGDGFRKHIERISKIESDIVVITGDFVDDDTTKTDMIKSCEALKLLSPKYGVYFIEGNHDRGYYNYRNYSVEELEDELRKNDVIVLRDEIKEINDKIYLVGREDKSNDNRKSIDELVKDLDKNKYIIDLNHQPNDYENEKNAGVDLVLSGHTHGGQLFPLGPLGVLFKANDAYYGLEKRDNTTFIVNSGISDWAIIFKTGTKSEFGVIDIIRK